MLGNAAPAGVGARRDRARRTSSTTTRTSTSTARAELLIPRRPARRRSPSEVAGAGRATRSGRCAATAWPGSTSSTRRAAGASCCNEVNTIPGFTPISMYPKLWAGARPVLRRADRRARAPGPRAPRPPPRPRPPALSPIPRSRRNSRPPGDAIASRPEATPPPVLDASEPPCDTRVAWTLSAEPRAHSRRKPTRIVTW